MCEVLWEPNLKPDELFETISQALVNAADRDAISGWGAVVYIVEKDKITEKNVKTETAMLKDITALIIRHTVITRRHLTPELPLRLITPDCPLWGAKGEEVPFPDPFWGFYWPGGQGTARYILDNGEIVRNRSVLDIGCGCGAGSIAAAKMHAKRVLANDIDVYALAATKINAKMNKVNFECFETSENNFIGTKLENFDTILVGDMFYDVEFAKFLFEWLRSLASEGKIVLIGDPGRHGLTTQRQHHITQLCRYELSPDTREENHGFTETSVWMVNER